MNLSMYLCIWVACVRISCIWIACRFCLFLRQLFRRICALRVFRAAVERAAPGLARDELAVASRIGALDACRDGLCVLAPRIIGAAKELSPPPPFYHHRLSAERAYLIGRDDLLLDALHLLLRLLDKVHERAVEALQGYQVVYLALLYAVEFVLHLGGELLVYYL